MSNERDFVVDIDETPARNGHKTRVVLVRTTRSKVRIDDLEMER
jgi:hypothetical protein